MMGTLSKTEPMAGPTGLIADLKHYFPLLRKHTKRFWLEEKQGEPSHQLSTRILLGLGTSSMAYCMCEGLVFLATELSGHQLTTS
jgi:hypothetical protein